MDQQLLTLIAGHKWWLLASIVIGLFVRLLKSDASFFPTLPESLKRWKPAIAIALGVLVGVCNALATGTPWVDAIVSGAVAGLLPVLGHQLLIEKLRDGKEIPVSLPPVPPALCLLFALALTACPKVPNTPREMARGYLAVMGIAAQSSVHACAESAKAMKAAENPDWKPLATECADAYDVAHTALFAVESALDTWDETEGGKLACAAGTALEGIERISRAMSTRSIPLRPEVKAQVEDGMRIAGYLLKTYGGVCVVPARDGGK